MATLDDLYRVEGQAELIAGRIVRSMPVGPFVNGITGRIFRSLADHADRIGRGFAGTATLGFAVPELSSGRQSFSPDVSYYVGPLPANRMRFVEGPPTLAVEVRNEMDYGPPAEAEIAAKRADYFDAGTLVVWDVDPVAETITAYRAASPDLPVIFTRGRVAEAEPAAPRWRVEVDWVFR